MARLLIALLAFFFTDQALGRCEDLPLPAQFKNKWQEVRDQYRLPRGNFSAMPPQSQRPGARAGAGDREQPLRPSCNVSTDLDGDGSTDFARVYEYAGPEDRGDDWTLDLVIMYEADGVVERVVFPYAGAYSEDGQEIDFFLVEQPPGVVDLQPGRMTLDRPGLLAYRDGKPAVLYYWDGDTIAQQTIAVDD